MRGWLAALVEWITGTKQVFSSQIFVQEMMGTMTVGQIYDASMLAFDEYIRAKDTPRLAEWLARQVTSASFTPWALFRD